MVNSRTKGAAGEREAGKWLQAKFRLANAPERNLEQVRSGGHDLVGFPPFAFEVKRTEGVSKRAWWLQAHTSRTKKYNIAVVMYRKSRQPWRFLISARYVGCKNGFIQLEEREFIGWANHILKKMGEV